MEMCKFSYSLLRNIAVGMSTVNVFWPVAVVLSVKEKYSSVKINVGYL